MKVLMTTDTVGGVWSYSLELSRALGGRGFAVVLASMGDRPSRSQREAAMKAGVTLVESGYRVEWMSEPWDDVAAAGSWLLDLAARNEPDVVHLNGYAHGTREFAAPVLMVAHSDVLSWWSAVKGVEAPPQWDRYRAAVGAGLAGADLVVAPTRAMLAALERHHDFEGATRVIYNGRDSAEFRPAEKLPYALSVGRLWDEAKNIAALSRLAPGLRWPVRVAGDARSPDGAELSLAPLVALGHLAGEELAAQLAHASIYCLPARYEPFGLSVLEAAHAGCALVLGDIETLRELWDGAAEFVPPGDDAALAAALDALIADPARRARLADEARGRARRFGVDRMADAYAGAYRELCVRGRRAGRRPAARDAVEEAACAS
ncbi:MAG TPA: glycosyltransferase family 4 protein [Gemmatimonadaceae bacterium]|nr:glycosyltransferase family 4 protein [Gemmatimonadaceae bacterium]